MFLSNLARGRGDGPWPKAKNRSVKSRNVSVKEIVVFGTYLRRRCSSQLLSNHGAITQNLFIADVLVREADNDGIPTFSCV